VTSVILSGNALIAPSVDRFTWVWSGEQRQSLETGELMLSSSYGTLQTTVVVPWLAGREVHSLRVSPDGTRVAVVSSANGIAHIEVAGIVRDAMNAPLSLGDPVTVGGQITGANAVAWQDESTLWVIGHTANNEAESLFGVSISGPSEVIAPAEKTHTLTAARGPRAVILGSDQGVIRTRGSSGASWSEESLDAWFPTYPG
jgi:WD40 repeat protein